MSLKESCYKIYKQGRDMVEQFRGVDLQPEVREFVDTQERIAESYDRRNKNFYYRWLNETYLLFRFHKGGLDESMETIQIIETFEQLVSIVAKYWDSIFTQITIEPYSYDDRIKWETQIVMIHVKDKKYPVGYLNREPNKEFWNITQQGEVNEVEA
jgi:hypothetical protein